MRRLLALVAVSGAAVVPVSGCSSPFSPPSAKSPTASSSPTSSEAPTSTGRADKPLPDPSALLHEAIVTAQGLTTTHLVMSVVGRVPETAVKELEADLTNDNRGTARPAAPASPTTSARGGHRGTGKAEDDEPEVTDHSVAAAKGVGRIAILGAEVDFRFVILDDHLYVAMADGPWTHYGETNHASNVTALLDPEDGLAGVLANFVDPKAETRETVGGEQTVRITGKVTPAAVNKYMPQFGATERIPATVWIQEKGERQVVEVSLEPTKGNFVQLTFSDWNEPVTVKKPSGT